MTGQSIFLGTTQQLRARQSSAKVCRSPVSVRAESNDQVTAVNRSFALEGALAQIMSFDCNLHFFLLFLMLNFAFDVRRSSFC